MGHATSFIQGIHFGRALEAAETALAVEQYDRARQLLNAAGGLADQLVEGEHIAATRHLRAAERKMDAALVSRVAPAAVPE